MKKLLIFLIFLAFVGVAGIYYKDQITHFFYFSACDTPIPYKLGRIDSGFNVSAEDFLQDIDEATTIWAKAYGKPLFVLDNKATLTVNLVFDERQALTNQINNLDSQLKNEKNSITPEMQAYQNKVHDFQTRMTNLNNEINYWNSKGGAPKDVYDQIIAEQNALKDEAAQLNQMAQSLNRETDSYNTQVGQLNQTVNNLDTVTQVKPEEGLYDPNDPPTISIYYNHGHDELVHTLAHEFGHALGMKHVKNSTAIMYTQTNDSLTPTNEDLAELQYLCRKQTILDRIQAEVNVIKSRLQQPS